MCKPHSREGSERRVNWKAEESLIEGGDCKVMSRAQDNQQGEEVTSPETPANVTPGRAGWQKLMIGYWSSGAGGSYNPHRPPTYWSPSGSPHWLSQAEPNDKSLPRVHASQPPRQRAREIITETETGSSGEEAHTNIHSFYFMDAWKS